MKRFRALIFDVDGTLAETEDIHRRAFNDAFAHFGIDWNWDVPLYADLLRVTGGKERIRHFARLYEAHSSDIPDGRIAEIHRYKTARYVELMSEGACSFRPGVEDTIDKAIASGMRLAIATTTSRENIEALFQSVPTGIKLDSFSAVVAGEDVAEKKPAPDAYLKVLDLLGVQGRDCLAIEDSRNGLVSASRAGIPVLITRSRYFQNETFEEAFAIVDSLNDLAAKNFDLSDFEVRRPNG